MYDEESIDELITTSTNVTMDPRRVASKIVAKKFKYNPRTFQGFFMKIQVQ